MRLPLVFYDHHSKALCTCSPVACHKATIRKLSCFPHDQAPLSPSYGGLSTCWYDAGCVNAAGCHKGKGQEESHCDVSASHCFVVESCTASTTFSLGVWKTHCLSALLSGISGASLACAYIGGVQLHVQGPHGLRCETSGQIIEQDACCASIGLQ